MSRSDSTPPVPWYSVDAFLQRADIGAWQDHFARAIAVRSDPARHGDLPAWQASLRKLPAIKPHAVNLAADAIELGQRDQLNDTQFDQLEQALRELSPWRKGPYSVFGCTIDTEWRSDWKWQRLAPHISDLGGRKVLDVGCGTGYHGWRMLGAGANYVLGIDPSMRFFTQFQAIQQFARNRRFDFLPIGIEDMPSPWRYFDSVFSMGVLYHRRNPINHLLELRDLLRPGGELILETLIIDEDSSPALLNGVLHPDDRYAMMRNVWSVMTVAHIEQVISDAGFENLRCVDQNITSLDEQRRTSWMQFHSLQQFLDPQDHSKTIEGYPAPKRGIFVASKP